MRTLQQAKIKPHAWERLIRPSLHVHMVWAHGAGFNFAVSASDFLKDTNNNVEAISRMMCDLYVAWTWALRDPVV